MLQARVLTAHILLLLVTVLGAFFLVSGGVLRPLIVSLNDERTELAVFLVNQAEEAPDVERRLKRLARLVQIKVEVFDHIPPRSRRHLRRARRRWVGDHEVLVFPGPHSLQKLCQQAQIPTGPSPSMWLQVLLMKKGHLILIW